MIVNRQEAARYGLAVEDIQEVVETAIGGMNITTTVEGRERYPVNIRYARELRGDIEQLKRILVPVTMTSPQNAQAGSGMGSGGAAAGQSSRVPLGQVADIKIVKGPTAIKSEEGLLSLYVFVDFSGRDVGGYVQEAKKKSGLFEDPGRISSGMERGI